MKITISELKHIEDLAQLALMDERVVSGNYQNLVEQLLNEARRIHKTEDKFSSHLQMRMVETLWGFYFFDEIWSQLTTKHSFKRFVTDKEYSTPIYVAKWQKEFGAFSLDPTRSPRACRKKRPLPLKSHSPIAQCSRARTSSNLAPLNQQ